MCNLSCQNCDHLAPYFGKNHYSFEDFSRDVDLMSEIAVASKVRLLGGEPLLNPNLKQYVLKAKESLTKDLHLCTNGTLLLSYKDTSVFNEINTVTISTYSSVVKTPEAVNNFKVKVMDYMKQFSCKVDFYYVDSFFDKYTKEKVSGEKSWQDCQVSKNCHSVYCGKFSMCSLFPKWKLMLNRDGVKEDFESDLFDLNCSKQDRLDGLAKYLKRNAFQTCNYCIPHSKSLPHKQLPVLQIF